MQINYPGGTAMNHQHKNKFQKRKRNKKPIAYGKRGMSLEENISKSNETYRVKNKAIIYKKPTPIQVVSVDYPQRSAAKITEAYYRKASTTDYNGVYRGYYIDFEAKETRNKTSFPLSNFHEHQIKHLYQCHEHGGIAFAILSFSTLNRLFVLDAMTLYHYWNQQYTENGNKSIPLNDIISKGIELNYGFAPIIPYLEAIDKYIADKEQNETHKRS